MFYSPIRYNLWRLQMKSSLFITLQSKDLLMMIHGTRPVVDCVDLDDI